MGPYFEAVLAQLSAQQSSDGSKPISKDTEVHAILGEADLELVKNLLKKAWLEDFHSFVMNLGGKTAEIMGHILKTEADFRTMNITLNSFGRSMGSQQKLADRNALYPSIG